MIAERHFWDPNCITYFFKLTVPSTKHLIEYGCGRIGDKIDFLIIDNVKDVRVLNRLSTGNYHRMVRAKVVIIS